jgi:predicted transcriptional regulator
MPRKASRQPTDAELAVLQALWELGPSTVREIHVHLSAKQSTGYTTTLKTLQIMTEKGLVERDASSRAHVYATKHSQEQTQRSLMGDLLERAYRGSAGKLALQALSSQRATPQEIAELRLLLDEMSREADDDDN